MFCSQCGHKDLNSGSFCTKCGCGLNLSATNGATVTQANDAAPSQTQGRDDQGLISFVGDRYHDYYRDKWLDDNGDYKTGFGIYSFNVAGFFLTVYWLCYRKMYGTAFMLSMVLPLFDLIMMYSKGAEGYDAIDGMLYGFLWVFATGLLGNHFYLKHAIKKVKKMSAGMAIPREQLARAGGTSLVGSLAFGTLNVLFITLIYLLFAPSWY